MRTRWLSMPKWHSAKGHASTEARVVRPKSSASEILRALTTVVSSGGHSIPAVMKTAVVERGSLTRLYGLHDACTHTLFSHNMKKACTDFQIILILKAVQETARRLC